MHISSLTNNLSNRFYSRYNLQNFRPIKLQGNASPHHKSADIFKNVVTIYGNDVYTKEEAVSQAWSQKNAINLDDLFSGKIKTLAPTTPPSDFILSLEQESTPPPIYFQAIKFELNYRSDKSLAHNVNHFASIYTAARDYINTSLTGVEKESNQQKLNTLLHAAKDTFAQEVSETIGGFFEEYGVSGEKESIYRSILYALDTRITECFTFIESNKDYAKLDGTKDQWLKSNSTYMASELRKQMKDTTFETNKISDCYSLDELTKMKTFAEEMKEYAHQIHTYGNEEEIGMQLSELVLKGELFNQYANVSDKVKSAVRNSIDGIIFKTVEQTEKNMEEQIRMRGKQIPSYLRKGLTAIDPQSIYAVINWVKSTYQRSGDFYKSMLDGATFAKSQYDIKNQMSSFTGIFRYQRSGYWNHFFQSSVDSGGSGLSGASYFQKESGIESIVKSWNAFANGFTADDSAKLNIYYFSTYA